MIFAAWAMLQTPPQVASLDDYLKLDTGKPSWTAGPKNKEFTELRLNSLTWQGDQWRHEIIIAGENIKSDTVILNLTGDRMENKMDAFTTMFSKTTAMPVVTVYGVPNQPLFGAREDELIGVGFTKYFMTTDPTWPLYLPMTKSAIQAMDAVEEWSKGRFKKFILTGTSKRGATSWLVSATGDKRVVGIAPFVADFTLDMIQQMKNMKTQWGQYSPEIPDFKKFDPLPYFTSPKGLKMMDMTDASTMMDKVKVPVLIVNGGNDKFTTVDSTRVYWDKIKSPKLFKMIPNASHFFAIPNALHEGYIESQALDAMRAVRYFAECISGKVAGGLPDVNVKTDPRRKGSRMWTVGSPTLWIQDSAWKQGSAAGSIPVSASFEEVEYAGNGYKASFTSLVNIAKKS